MTPIRVLIADDDAALRDSLADLITDDESLTLVGAAKDADEAIALGRREHPDVALLDVRMPLGGGPRASREILQAHPDTRVIAFTAYEERASAVQMIRAGATSYILKGSRSSEILEAIHLAAEGQGVLPPQFIPDVLGELAAQLEQREREDTEHELRIARIRHEIDSDAALVVFQPIFDLRSGDVVGLEALTRFTTAPQRPPGVWFAEAASVGLLQDLELAAAKRAIVAARELPRGPYISLNLSPRTLVSRRTYEVIREAPGDVVIEVTEHAPVGDYEELHSAIQALRDGGGKLAVDDAGAGYASLRHILRLGPDIIKLDISLTRDIHLDRRRRALAAAMITFAEELGATIVAEGIESELELAALRSLGVPDGQGFFLCRPAPTAEIVSFMQRRRAGGWGPWPTPGIDATAPGRISPPVALPARSKTPGPPEPAELALDDGLTGLRNRPAFLVLGEQVLAVAARLGRPVTLLSLCLENMKTIGDTFGHEEADRALGEVGALLSSTFRESDVLGRVEGDEFCVLLVDEAGSDGSVATAQLLEALEALNARSGRSYRLGLGTGTVSTEVGVRPSLEELMARAHRCMHLEKLARQGRPLLLVGEDDPGGQNLLRAIFAERCELTFASRGEETLELAGAARPDLVLLDAALATVGGLDVVRALRSNRRRTASRSSSWPARRSPPTSAGCGPPSTGSPPSPTTSPSFRCWSRTCSGAPGRQGERGARDAAVCQVASGMVLV